MRLLYYTGDINFGDSLNEWLWHRLIPSKITGAGPHFSGIGTLSADRIPVGEPVVIFTSGVGYGAFPNLTADTHVVCVRGPLSAKALGLQPEAAVTDGAALLATLDDWAPSSKRKGTVFMPHHRAEDLGGYDEICDRCGIEYLSPRGNSFEIIDRLRNAELVLAGAMHAAIVADAMRVPWVPIVTSRQINTFKWLDWTFSLQLPYKPVFLGPPHTTAALHNWSHNWAGTSYYFDPTTPENALKRQQRISRQHGNVKKRSQHIRRVLRKMDHTLPSTWRQGLDHRLVTSVARALIIASKQKPILSEYKTFTTRLGDLERRLAQL